MTLRIAGDTEELGGAVSSITVHHEPIELARSLIFDGNTTLPHVLVGQIGQDSPLGKKWSADDVDRAVSAIEATLASVDPDNESMEPDVQELSRALALFRTAHAHGRAVSLED